MLKSLKKMLPTHRITSARTTAVRLGSGDDYNWGSYNRTYRAQIAKMEKDLTLHLTPYNYRLEDGELSIATGYKPMHPNHRLLYETLLQLQPGSIAEIGCGGGDHLRNLSVLFDETLLRGYDRSADQLEFLVERSPNLAGQVTELDITLPLPKDLSQVDVCYTQAVIMHIQAANSHLVALTNLFHLATKQVVLMENWARHEFLADIRMLHQKKMLPWQELYFYYRPAPEYQNRAHLMIASSEPLPYAELNDYAVFASDADVSNAA